MAGKYIGERCDNCNKYLSKYFRIGTQYYCKKCIEEMIQTKGEN